MLKNFSLVLEVVWVLYIVLVSLGIFLQLLYEKIKGKQKIKSKYITLINFGLLFCIFQREIPIFRVIVVIGLLIALFKVKDKYLISIIRNALIKAVYGIVVIFPLILGVFIIFGDGMGFLRLLSVIGLLSGYSKFIFKPYIEKDEEEQKQ